MSLTSALRIAQNSLMNTGIQTTVTSRNISEASNPNYVRRDAVLVSTGNGARVVNINRATSDDLLWDSLQALSDSKAQSIVSNGANRLQRLVNGADNSTSAATLLANFEDALQLYGNDSSNTLLAESAVGYAKELSDGLNSSSLAIQEYRAELDQNINSSVGELNNLLDQFKQVNDEIVKGTGSGQDVNNALDQRDTLLKQISEYVSVSVVKRDNNDFVLYTDQGVTLFETVPREVSFQPLSSYSAGITGNTIRIDGVPVIGGVGADSNATGTLEAMIQLRDTVTVDMQAQLDEIARSMVTIFAETDTLGGGPDLAGLFTYAGGPAIPLAGTIATGIAQTIGINPAYDPSVGGNPELLRDGGANGASYVANTTGEAGFADQLIGFLDRMNAPVATDPSAGITGSYSVSEYSESSIGWLESLRSRASAAADGKGALFERLQSSLSSKTGVNMDEEMAILVELEQSYQASARIVQALDEMMQTLLNAV